MNQAQKFRIIIADDEPSIREILSELLEGEGYDCVTAHDGLDAIQKLQQESFNLLISDFRMPRMNGAELLEWCRDHHLHMPAIFITANNELFPEEKLALNDCCAALLQKPIDLDQLLFAIDQAKVRNHNLMCQL